MGICCTCIIRMYINVSAIKCLPCKLVGRNEGSCRTVNAA